MALAEPRATQLREGLLALGFALLLLAAALTVALPELTKEPEGAGQAQARAPSGAPTAAASK